MSSQEIKQEIIIIKRKRGGEEGHHGGVWKIAYADFMTAMMAFFLVMWLVNASNEKTRAQVASYFNPVKLVDSTAQPRGLDEKKGEDVSTDYAKQKVLKTGSKSDSVDKMATEENKAEVKKRKAEAELFRAPMKALDKIAGGLAKEKIKAIHDDQGDPNSAEQHVSKFQDPFAPKAWQVQKVDSKSVKNNSKADMKSKNTSKLVPQKKIKEPAKALAAKVIAEKARNTKIAVSKKHEIKADVKTEKNIPKPKSNGKRAAKFSQLKAEIENVNNGDGPRVEVTRNKQGLLVSLTDDVKFGMFQIASAQPAQKMVLFMEKIAKILASKLGKIVVRGHTDGRPFHSKEYDNWRLSTARAQIARFMLIRGGVKEERFARIEGYADRKLKFAAKPFDARNRRIEILILD